MALVPLPDESMILSGISLAPCDTPVTPVELLAAAPTMPATCVPWPISSRTEQLAFVRNQRSVMGTNVQIVPLYQLRSPSR